MRSESGDFYYAQLSGAGFRFLRHSSSSMGPGAKINRPKTELAKKLFKRRRVLSLEKRRKKRIVGAVIDRDIITKHHLKKRRCLQLQSQHHALGEEAEEADQAAGAHGAGEDRSGSRDAEEAPGSQETQESSEEAHRDDGRGIERITDTSTPVQLSLYVCVC
uniref:Uncharacterized protein n=1 Tax=Cyprinus carpio carpio TaxID=630221 RepID=A0A9J8CRK0_CYPCA